MFGYIVPVLSVLTPEQRSRYRSFYCGLCQALRKRCGQIQRLSLSNDMTFLALLLSSLYEPDTLQTEIRCGLHPFSARSCLSSAMIDYAADMNVFLFYEKCVDQDLDEHGLTGKAGMHAFRRAAEVIRELRPQQSARIEKALTRLWEEEKHASPDPDLLCNLSGEMLSAVFVPRPDDLWAPLLHSVGAGLGRFIYWMDAWEDYDADIRKGRFNPLSAYHSRPDYEDFCHDILEMMIAEATDSFERLPLEQDLDLLRNVLYSGVWQRYLQRKEKQNKRKVYHVE